MKNINKYINEKLHVTTKSFYSCQPKTKDELQEIIIQRIKDEGNECNLNDIDVSDITDMSLLFNSNPGYHSGNEIFRNFNSDISQWNVSNVKNMMGMFYRCEKFNCDLSLWDVSNVTDMKLMFAWCEKFKHELNRWNVSNVENMSLAFIGCKTKPKWYDRKKCGEQ